MRRVFLECKGRLANQLIAWAKASFAFRNQPDVELTLDYPELSTAILPATRVERFDSRKLQSVNYPAILTEKEDAVWMAEDLWQVKIDGFGPETARNALHSIQFPEAILNAVASTIPNGNFIGVHVRHGDYQKIVPGKLALPLPVFIRAPEHYYLQTIEQFLISFPASNIFLASDGTVEDLEFITKKYQCAHRSLDSALLDFLCLAKCFVLIGSFSTFSQLASIYGNMPLILPTYSPHDLGKIATEIANNKATNEHAIT